MSSKEFDLAFYSALTPLHIGVGRAPGAVDLPIARDSFGLPFIPGSSIKGSVKSFCLRECSRRFDFCLEKRSGTFGGSLIKDPWENPCLRYFGWDLRLSETGAEEAYISPISLTDAFLFLFPVKYETGEEVGFGYATSDLVLQQAISMTSIVTKERENSDIELNDVKPYGELYLNGVSVSIDEVSKLHEKFKDNDQVKVLLGLLDNMLETKPESEILSLVKYLLKKDDGELKLFVVPTSEFKEVVEAGIMRMTRVRLDYVRKAVERGALWTEEYVPQGAVFLGLAEYNFVVIKDECAVDPPDARTFLNKVLDMTSNILDVGGKETIGKGLVHVSLQPQER